MVTLRCNMLRVVIVLGLYLCEVVAFEYNCGYDACRKTTSDKVNVHLVAHSHDDVGWLKTVDQYYYGERPQIQDANVERIITSVVKALLDNKDRRFIQVESIFFHKWWHSQDENTKEKVRGLVNNGQLEFVGGGWSMNDEAAAHYQSIIDQFTLGLTFLNETFGKCGIPRTGWQIDPFGHSREMAAIFAQLGYDGEFFARADWADKVRRREQRTLEMLWQGSNSLGSSSNIFTSILYDHYTPPNDFCFDELCPGTYFGDDDYKINQFAMLIRNMARAYQTSNLLIPMGEDFSFQDAFYHFDSIDKLIRGFKKWPQRYGQRQIDVFYSTPSCYLKSVNEEAASKKLAFPVKTDDFFPYSSDAGSYWTGYFTSRPTSKRFERQAHSLLRVHKQLEVQHVNMNYSFFELANAVGIMQHHDAITGTEKQHVADDYSKIMDSAIRDSEKYTSSILSKVLAKNKEELVDLDFKSCLLANVSVCAQSLGDHFLVTVYNPLSRSVDYYPRIPVDYMDYEVKSLNGKIIPYQISLSIDNFKNYGDQRHHTAYNLHFLAESVPPLGVQLYSIRKRREVKEHAYNLQEVLSADRFVLGDEENGIKFDWVTRKLKSVMFKGREIPIKQDLLYYKAATGENYFFHSRSSGAYIFRPQKQQVTLIGNFTDMRTFKGKLFDEAHISFGDWAKQIVRFYKKSGLKEVDWLVGPIPIGDRIGKEIISRYSTQLKTASSFYTDSNGKEMMLRRRNYRPTYDYISGEFVSSNYYPVTSKITLEDTLRFSVITDRSQGGSSLSDGDVELMLHRRLLRDDGFGVGEPLNEMQFGHGLVARGTHRLVITDDIVEEKKLQQEVVFEPWTFVSNITNYESIRNVMDNFNSSYSGLKRELPQNVHILSLEPHSSQKDTILLRLEHSYEIDESPIYSQDVVIDLTDLFTAFQIITLKETTLGGNQWLEENDRLRWIPGDRLEFANYKKRKDIGKDFPPKLPIEVQREDDLRVKLKPMQIRTFIARIKFI